MGEPGKQAVRALHTERAGSEAGWHPRLCGGGQKGQQHASPTSTCAGPPGHRWTRIRVFRTMLFAFTVLVKAASTRIKWKTEVS